MKPLPRLVIDASIAGAAGQSATPTSKHCRDFLETVQTMNYPVALPPPLLDEWRKHATKSARIWLVRMLSKPRRFVDEVPESPKLRREIEEAALQGLARKLQGQAKQVVMSKWGIVPDKVEKSPNLQRKIEEAAAPRVVEESQRQKVLAAMRKDFHLLEAALATDKRVISRDEMVHRFFHYATAEVNAIKSIVWVNPMEGATAIVWLEKNAKAERKRMLDREPAAILE